MFLKRSFQLFRGEWGRRGQDHEEATAAVQLGDFNDLDQDNDVVNGEPEQRRRSNWLDIVVYHSGEAYDVVKGNFQVSGLQNAHRIGF